MEALRAVDVAVVVGDDLVAGLVKPFGDLGTYSAGPPGDDRHARHCLLPSAVFLQSRPATGGNNDDRRPPYRSRQMAMPMPPPIHRVASPRRASRSRRSEEHTSELQSLMRISYAVFCLKKKNIR